MPDPDQGNADHNQFWQQGFAPPCGTGDSRLGGGQILSILRYVAMASASRFLTAVQAGHPRW